jgi:hypothetical protein
VLTFIPRDQVAPDCHFVWCRLACMYVDTGGIRLTVQTQCLLFSSPSPITKSSCLSENPFSARLAESSLEDTPCTGSRFVSPTSRKPCFPRSILSVLRFLSSSPTCLCMHVCAAVSQSNYDRHVRARYTRTTTNCNFDVPVYGD